MRIGLGYDAHRFIEGRPLVLGGIDIPYSKGLDGHSDADVLTHAVMDSLLGAVGLPDIGCHFPSSDPQYFGISSIFLLSKVVSLIEKEGYSVGNIDCVICAQEPILSLFIKQMRSKIAKTLNVDLQQVNIKATTTEKMGFVGRLEGIEAQAVSLLQ